MGQRLYSGLKDGLFVFISIILIALVLNFTGLDFGHNRIWNALAKLNLVNIFSDKELNGLIVLAFILGILSFVFGSLSPDKK